MNSTEHLFEGQRDREHILVGRERGFQEASACASRY